MRKEAINIFSEGLIMDLNPLTTPSNVMTSCLNGTLITYNGNEFVLQNDMGNGRVETAYLPSGYVPVGIKEFGGIIYVASYNPLTNKGQLGSFPSPERNISSNEVSSMEKQITEEDFIDKEGKLTSAIQKVNLFEDGSVLRSGDKFSIVIAGSIGDRQIAPEELRKYLSNYLNTKNGKVISPKNKILTLKACVIDANSNLRDITSQLKRIDFSNNNKVIEFDEKTPQLLKDNTSYYALPSEINEDPDTYRKNKALNVYNNKVFGELYIVATLNTIQRVDFSISGSRENDKANLQLDMTYYYNCPDGFYDKDKNEGDDFKGDSRYTDLYNTYECIYGRSKDFPETSEGSYNLIKGYQFKLDNFTKQVPFEIGNSIKNIEYLASENLYKVTNTYPLEPIDIKKNKDNTIVDNDVRTFTAIPAMTYATLPGLTVTGTINLAKLGSGEMNLNTWRYFCNNDTVTLTWGFEAYLKTGQRVETLEIKFYDVETKTNVLTFTPTKKYNYNGSFTDILGYQEGIQPGKLYLAVVRCTLSTEDPNTGKNEVRDFARWLLTTSLYNQHYFDTQDFINLDNLNNSTFTGLNDVNIDVAYNTKDISSEPKSTLRSYTPELLTKDDQIILSYRSGSRVKQIDSSIQYRNADKYPFQIPLNRYSVQYTADQDNSTIEWNGILGGQKQIPSSVNIEHTSHSTADLENDNVKTNVLTASISDSNKISIQYKVPSFVLGKKTNEAVDLHYSKVLSNYGNRIDSILGGPVSDGTIPPFAVQLVFREKQQSGHRDLHGYGFFPIQYDKGTWKFFGNAETHANYIMSRQHDGEVTYMINDDWTTTLRDGIQKTLGFTPLIIFITFKQVAADLGDAFRTSLGQFKKRPTDIKSIILWFDGEDYRMVNGYSENFTGALSMLNFVQNDLNKIYIKQLKDENLTGYVIDPENSSYVMGGSFNVNVNFKAKLGINNTVKPLPEYLTQLNQILDDIELVEEITLTNETKARLVETMTFKVNETSSINMSVQIQDQLINMQPIFNDIQMLFNTKQVNAPVIVDKSDGSTTVYQYCGDGTPIDEFTIYTKEGNSIIAANGRDLVAKYADAFTIKLIDNTEYQLVPKSKSYIGSPRITADAGDRDSYTKLDFGRIKMVDITIGPNTLL